MSRSSTAVCISSASIPCCPTAAAMVVCALSRIACFSASDCVWINAVKTTSRAATRLIRNVVSSNDFLSCSSIESSIGLVRTSDGEVPGRRSQGRGRVAGFFESVRRVAISAVRAGLPVACRIPAGSPHSFCPDRARPAKALATRSSLYAFPATVALASPGGAPVPRGAP